MTLLAAQTALWLALGLAAGLLFAIAVWALFAVFFAVFDGGTDDIADVQRFIELTEEARRLVPPGLPLLDSDKAAATTTAIVRFQAKKDDARRALWASRDRRRAIAIAEPATARRAPSVVGREHGGLAGWSSGAGALNAVSTVPQHLPASPAETEVKGGEPRANQQGETGESRVFGSSLVEMRRERDKP